jgi:ABC-type Fe3+/spermidine/putrescine transport system ATPase subunit
MIAGFEYPSNGEIRLGGREIKRIPPEERNIGMVFQNYALFPHMTIGENIEFPLKMRKVPKEERKRRVRESLALVRLDGYEGRYPKQLSGGQQQRIALARAVVFNAPVLLMDEPLGALDKKLREEMQLEIKEIQRKLKRTVIYVTHDQEEALVMSDRIVVLNRGCIEQLGSPNELYERPGSKFVAGFIGESNFIEGRVSDKQGQKIEVEIGGRWSQKVVWYGDDVELGDSLCFSIRPEKLKISREEKLSCFIKGVIDEVIYVGEVIVYKIDIGIEVMIRVKEMNVKEGGSHKKGDEVALVWEDNSLKRVS